jgi:23S rRNA (guanosine2251-2'-O)-methyltransferase
MHLPGSTINKSYMEKLTAQEMERMSVEEFKKTAKIPFILVLDNVRSMHNVGSIFRTADAFKIEKILLGGITAQPPHREIQKTALGATESVDWEHQLDLKASLQKYKNEGYKVYAIEQTKNSVFLNQFRPSKGEKIVVIFGNEVEGVSEDIIALADATLEIPQFGTKHSFNVSVTAGMVIWDLWNKIQ